MLTMIIVNSFDKLNNSDIKIFTLKNQNLEVSVLNLGGIIQSFKVNGNDIVLGFNFANDYLKYDIYSGAVIGRVANIINNSTFTLNNETYTLKSNAGKHCNHSGISGFDKVIFSHKIDGEKLILTHFSPDNDGGFPGNMNFSVEYSLEDNALIVKFTAISDKTTPFAPTLHPYFNLDKKGNIYDTMLKINGNNFTPVNENGVPTGEVFSALNTPFDFTDFKAIGKDIFKDNLELKRANGYDINYLTSSEHKCTAKTPGLTLDIYSDMPCLQLYTANDLNGEVGKNGSIYTKHSAFCLEPQFAPNAVNQNNFTSPIINANTKVTHYIKYQVK